MSEIKTLAKVSVEDAKKDVEELIRGVCGGYYPISYQGQDARLQ